MDDNGHDEISPTGRNKGGRPELDKSLSRSNRLRIYTNEQENLTILNEYRKRTAGQKRSLSQFILDELFRGFNKTQSSIGPISISGDGKDLAMLRLILNDIKLVLKKSTDNHNQVVKRINGMWLPDEVKKEIAVESESLKEIAANIKELSNYCNQIQEYLYGSNKLGSNGKLPKP